uniref:Uncharacterized protein n=1 Tax=Setaria italica TaxID=4555 RepID=K3XNQ1_SETIT
MLGALAWQATVIKKYSCVRGRRSHGACFFGPGFSSPMVSLCLLLPVLPSSLELASTIAAAKTWSYSETHKISCELSKFARLTGPSKNKSA